LACDPYFFRCGVISSRNVLHIGGSLPGRKVAPICLHCRMRLALCPDFANSMAASVINLINTSGLPFARESSPHSLCQLFVDITIKAMAETTIVRVEIGVEF